MKMRYGVLPDAEFEDYRERLHSLIHWLLIYRDEANPCLSQYFEKVQAKLAGFSSLLQDTPLCVELMVLIESARVLTQKDECDQRLFRKMIFDAHELIDRIFDEL